METALFVLVFLLLEQSRNSFSRCLNRQTNAVFRRRLKAIKGRITNRGLTLVCKLVASLTIGLTLRQERRMCSLPR